jgi:hypothetical protein
VFCRHCVASPCTWCPFESAAWLLDLFCSAIYVFFEIRSLRIPAVRLAQLHHYFDITSSPPSSRDACKIQVYKAGCLHENGRRGKSTHNIRRNCYDSFTAYRSVPRMGRMGGLSTDSGTSGVGSRQGTRWVVTDIHPVNAADCLEQESRWKFI